MESSMSINNRSSNKRSKGFLKGKLQSMSLLHKPTSKPLPALSASTTNTRFLNHHDAKHSAEVPPPPIPIPIPIPIKPANNHPHPQGGRVAITVHQDQSLPQPTHRVSIQVLSIPAEKNDVASTAGGRESSKKHVKGKSDHQHHQHHPVDENVDLKATDYISSVKERFRVPPMLNS